MSRLLGTAAAGVLLSAVAACGSVAVVDQSGVSPRQTITVYAAASLKDSFTEIGKKFEAEHDGVTVKFNFAGSSDLVAQIQQGAPADVFASADTTNMDTAITAGLIEGPAKDFATNTLEIVTPPANPARITKLSDLTQPGIKVVLCAAGVPCGSAARQVEQATGIKIRPVSEEQSVTDVLGKVISGEADAGLVYVTDVKAAGDNVHGVTFPESSDVINTYPIAALKGSTHIKTAQLFASYVAGANGRAVLAAAGFARP